MNATELCQLPLPPLEMIIELGRHCRNADADHHAGLIPPCLQRCRDRQQVGAGSTFRVTLPTMDVT
ncbi:MAG: hypothetical protein SF123_06955 [Chloroflexota bacterium]|nr:hypothetical protein [Chloroflexota bacterium]